MKPFLHASCCAYKLFWQCHESNCMKGGSRKYVGDVDYMVQNIEKKITANYNFFEKVNQLKSHPIKNVRISSLTFIFIFWWIELAILRSHRKLYQNFIFNFEDIWKRKFVFCQTLSFLPHCKPLSSRVLVETSYSRRILYVIRP